MHKFLIVYEKTEEGYSAYSPDLDGCVASGKTKFQTEKNMYAAVEMHVHGLVEDKLPIPKPKSSSEVVLVNEKRILSS